MRGRSLQTCFDATAADRVELFFERVLMHISAAWAGEGFKLQPWQSKITRDLFGTKGADGFRRYRKAYIEIPRKNGKSTWAAGIALALLVLDDEPRGEVYSAAADKEQASIVFGMAKTMVEASPLLSKLCQVYRNSIVFPETGSAYKVLSADAITKHGLSPSGIIFDELHAQPNRELWDVLTTGVGARRQPLTIAITTAGFDKHSICYEQHKIAERVIENPEVDPAYYGVIYAAGPEDDWREPATWKKANPNFGVSVYESYFASEVKSAIDNPAKENTFRRLHLDQWTEQADRWISVTEWDACKADIDWESLRGRDCKVGLDLSSVRDLAALVLLFGDSNACKVRPFFWCPDETIAIRSREDKVPYDLWKRKRLIESCPGKSVDYSLIRKKINELRELYNITEIAIDPYNAHQISHELEQDGFEVSLYRQHFGEMNAPTKRFEKLVIEHALQHDGHEVLRWCFGNIAIEEDSTGNIKCSKKRSREKIDGIISLIMALGRRMISEGPKQSVYERRGIVSA